MKSYTPSKIWPAAVGTLLLMAAAGCGRDNVKVYHVDTNDVAISRRRQRPPQCRRAMPATMPDGLPAPDNNGLPSLQYTLPDGWEKKTPTQMRVASFGVSQDGKQADVSVIPLGGMAGTDPANVNRWRGQVGLAALPETDVAKLAEKVMVGDQPADLYDIAGTAPGSGDAERILGVILHRDDTAWFFKMTGDAAFGRTAKAGVHCIFEIDQFGDPPVGRSGRDGLEPVAAVASADWRRRCTGASAAAPASDSASQTNLDRSRRLAGRSGSRNFWCAKYVIAGADGAYGGSQRQLARRRRRRFAGRT